MKKSYSEACVAAATTRRYAVCDWETTGLAYAAATRIIEAAFCLVAGPVQRHWGRFMNPGHVPADIAHLTGITEQMLASSRCINNRQFIERLYVLEANKIVVFAHNASFEEAFVEKACRAEGMRVPKLLWACSMSLFRYCYPGKPYSQEAVAKAMGIKNPRAHRAMPDAVVCQQIVHRLLDKLQGRMVPELIEPAPYVRSVYIPPPVKVAVAVADEQSF